jgi:hypothetical protein
MVSQEGLLLGRGTLCSLFAVLFVLPGFLMTFDSIVIRSFGSGNLSGRGKEEETAENKAI